VKQHSSHGGSGRRFGWAQKCFREAYLLQGGSGITARVDLKKKESPEATLYEEIANNNGEKKKRDRNPLT